MSVSVLYLNTNMINLTKVLHISSLFLIFTVNIIVVAIVWTLPDVPPAGRNHLCIHQEGELSCGDQQNKLTSFIKRKIAEKYDHLQQEESKQDTNSYIDECFINESHNFRPAARYTAAYFDHDDKTAGTNHTLYTLKTWQKGRFVVKYFETYGVHLEEGRIIVPVGGYYHIYSFLDFYEDFNERMGPNMTQTMNHDLVHGIYRFNIREDDESMLVSHTQPHLYPYQRMFNIYGSYVAAIVQLKAGDEISVKVNHAEFLRDNHYNFFGLTLIS